ncbi:O-antigen ligase family protein [Aureisphaera galaxeae]|uniref:O-antigen ligase family protein n=1 Tax=Aureisphaera galaxeae TaxID=1538023 RepID=UPI0023507E51|nr:O-antigen ligase family protein [Aureisphaera galaxeae]MDC8005073.1 O-antigen ligase family protein [Aureisphaera galaxeae]
MSQNLIRTGIVLLIVALWTENLEISFLVSAGVLLFNFGSRFSKEVFTITSILFGLMCIGFLSLFTFDGGVYDFVKDFVYFLRPITILLAVYFSVKNLEKKTDFFNIVVLAGFSFALIHMVHIGVEIIGMKPGVDKFRNKFGRFNHVEMLALFAIICVRGLPVKKTRFKVLYQFFVILLAVSFLLYFSRTMMIVLVLMVLAYYGYLKLNARGAVALFGMLVTGGLFILFLSQYEPSETKNPTLISTFLTKMKNSYTETLEPIKFDKNKLDRRELWPRWRAYEASLVWNEVNEEKSWLTGKGFGSTVDVGFDIMLQGEEIRHLPTVHNGVAYVYMKTGLIGLLVYLSMIGMLYMQYYNRQIERNRVSFNRLLVACSFYIFASSLVVTGIFKPYDMATFLIGGILALKQFSDFENRNIRDEGNS